MTQRVLTERELNRALLHRQMLLERASVSIPARSSAWAACRRSTRLRCTSGWWSRMEGFERDALTRALERRSVVQAR